MAKPFHELREHLLRAGVAPRHVRRYISELSDHLADLTIEEERAGRSQAEAEATALLRLGSAEDLASAMTGQRQFLSLSTRAPWAIFGVGPVLLLAGAYFVAGLILWSGWKAFLPGSDTPFLPVRGLASYYFGVGRLLYFTAPLLIGWVVGLTAIRQRLESLWPVVGCGLIAWLGSAVQIHAGRSAVPSGLGHISMDLAVKASLQNTENLIYALVTLLLTLLPYLIWRSRQAESLKT
jgi:hypothetical protein